MKNCLLFVVGLSFFALTNAYCDNGASDGPWTGSYQNYCSGCITNVWNGVQTLTCMCGPQKWPVQITAAQCPSMNINYNVSTSLIGSPIYGTNFLCNGGWKQGSGFVTGPNGCDACYVTLAAGIETYTCNCNNMVRAIRLQDCPSRIVTTTATTPNADLACIGAWNYPYGCSSCTNSPTDTLSCSCTQFPFGGGLPYRVPASISPTTCPVMYAYNNNGTLICNGGWSFQPSSTTTTNPCTCNTPVWTGAVPATSTPNTPGGTQFPPSSLPTPYPAALTYTCQCPNGQTTTWNDHQCPSRTLEYDPLFGGLICSPWRLNNINGRCSDCFTTFSPTPQPNSMSFAVPISGYPNTVTAVSTLTCNCGTGTTSINSNLCPTYDVRVNTDSGKFNALDCNSAGWTGNFTAGCVSCGNQWSNSGNSPSTGVAQLTCVCMGTQGDQQGQHPIAQITSAQCPWLTVNEYNGKFMCMPWQGSYINSCSYCDQTVSGGVATLSCELCTGGSSRTTIDSNACPTMSVDNLYGQLTCDFNWCLPITNNINWGQFGNANSISQSLFLLSSTIIVAILSLTTF